MDVQAFQEEETAPVLKTVVKRNDDIQPLTDDIVSNILNSDVTENFLSASSTVIQNYKNGLLLNTSQPPVQDPDNEESSFMTKCQTLMDMAPPGALPIIIPALFILVAFLAYSSSFGILMGIITICVVIRIGMNTLVTSQENEAETEQITKQAMAIEVAQNNLFSVGLAVQNQSQRFHEKNLETMKKCEDITASARYGQTDAMVHRHQEDIQKVIGLTSKIQTGMTNRTNLRNKTMLTAVNKQCAALKDIATMDAKTDGQVLTSEKTIENETLSTNSSIASVTSSTGKKVKELETGWKSEMARKTAQNEKQRIESQKQAQIECERQATQAVKQNCDRNLQQHRQNLNDSFRANYGYNVL